MRSHGMSSNTYARFKGHSFGYDVTTLGWNYRMDEMRAAMGLVQLGKLTETNRARRPLVERYRARLAERLPHIGVPFAGWNGTYAYHIFPVLLPEGYTDRAGLMRRLADASVQTSIHYRPVHWLSDFGGGETLRLPVTDALAPRILTLPLFQTLAPEQVDYVVEALAEALG
jgi:dTDP-4-amino-4,6-dideoxygalactose transaminase